MQQGCYNLVISVWEMKHFMLEQIDLHIAKPGACRLQAGMHMPSFLKVDCVQIIIMHVCVCVCVCVCPRLWLLIASGVMWHDMDLV